MVSSNLLTDIDARLVEIFKMITKNVLGSISVLTVIDFLHSWLKNRSL